MEILVTILVAVVVLEAVVILTLRAKNKQLVVQNAVHLFKEHLKSEGESDSSYSEENVPEISDEEDQQQAEQVQKIQILCRLAEVHLDDLSDEYESKMLESRIDKAIEMAKVIKDPFYFSVALHPVINLAHKAGWDDKKNELLEMISDPLMKQIITKRVFNS